MHILFDNQSQPKKRDGEKSRMPRVSKRSQQTEKSRDNVVLIVLDGWGISSPGDSNAISQAKTPNFDSIKSRFGSYSICASGPCVGLKPGQMGNSEVGHLTIGAGRAIFQDLMRVDEEISSGRLGKNAVLVSALRAAKGRNSAVHFLGLVSDGGVHSHIDHLFELLRIPKDLGVKEINVHAILDGRDTSPKSGINFLASLQSYLDSLGVGRIATLSGRYYAMDRDNRWERTKLAFDAIVYGIGDRFENGAEALADSYDKRVTDEFVVPKVIGDYGGIKDRDVVFFFNFRPDRARQMTKALVLSRKEFGNQFDRNEPKRPKRLNMLSMTVYDPKLKTVVALLGREHVSDTLSKVLAKHHIRQLRIAETEKYAHVTYFFNGLTEKPEKFEDRILVPSLRIGTYDKKPEMSAYEIAKKSIEMITSKKYGFILINFANADMVGHSGNIAATIRAVETVDECLGKIVAPCEEIDNLTLVITADHGNAEKMIDEKTGEPHTAHTSNSVPLVIVSKYWKIVQIVGKETGLIDIAPSILKILSLQQPKAMVGRPVVTKVV